MGTSLPHSPGSFAEQEPELQCCSPSRPHLQSNPRDSSQVLKNLLALIRIGVQAASDIPYFVGNTSSSVTSFCTELMTKSTYWGAVHLTFFPRSSYQ